MTQGEGREGSPGAARAPNALRVQADLSGPGDAARVERAGAVLRRGELVAFPTETVYGLGANALDPRAVGRIFRAKGRPPDNPLIVHVQDWEAARRVTAAWPAAAGRLARAFWPGPLTLVLPRAPEVPDATTAGLDSVAVRVPRHPVARAVIEAAGVPVAAPSANRSGRPSPTRARDVVLDLGDHVDLVLDGGPTQVGVESTVVSLLEDAPRVLRPGGVPLEDLRAVVGTVRGGAGEEAARSPGTRYRHYAPSARVHIVPPEGLTDATRRLRAEGLRVAVLASREAGLEGPDVRVPGPRRDAAAWARALFALLRDLDAEGYDAIVVEEIPEAGVGAAVMDRLRRASEAGPR